MELRHSPGRISDDYHAINVERTLKELRRMVSEHEYALNQLRDDAVNIQFPDPQRSTKASLDATTEALKRLTKSEPFLPFQNSVLPALLALRRTHAAIRETQAFLASPETSTDKARRRLESEQANLKDQRALQSALKNRLHTLRLGLETKEGQSPDQLVEARMGQLRQQKRDYDRDTSALLKSLNQFIAKYLGSMLAAEELGGPVVGDMMEIDPDGLEAGFNAQGKPKRAKVSDADSNTRQRRLDQIWGTEGGDQTRPGSKKRDRDESVAAGAEMRNLVEDLLNSLVQSGGDTSAAYVKISRESAAVRFLVRSKVAQFHPKDATRLRLIDFGRELDD